MERQHMVLPQFDPLSSLRMDIHGIRSVQQSHSERLARLEKTNADIAVIKSAWGQPPFSAVGASAPPTESWGRAHYDPHSEFEESSQQLMGSLRVEADHEPARRLGQPSRANSVRFDESALYASLNQHARAAGDFGQVRPSSGFGALGPMERSLSHKSDGRHSSAGFSVLSIQSAHSLHSAPSGRGSSVGGDGSNAAINGDDASQLDIMDPPPGLAILGSCPTIIRCWLTRAFSHGTLIYAAVCTGSQRSTIDYSLLKELDLEHEIEHDVNGNRQIQFPVYLAEATVLNSSSSRLGGSGSQIHIPCITTTFHVVTSDQPDIPGNGASRSSNRVRVILGSDTLRFHSADVLLSRNMMMLVGDEREKLMVPFVRPEDESTFKHLTTTNVSPGKPKLNAAAAPFVVRNSSFVDLNGKASSASDKPTPVGSASPMSSYAGPPDTRHENQPDDSVESRCSESVERSAESFSTIVSKKETGTASSCAEASSTTASDTPTTGSAFSRRDSAPSGMWGSWRPVSLNGGESMQKDGSQAGSGQYAVKSSRNMRVLKPSKLSSLTSSARTGNTYEPAASKLNSETSRRKTISGSSITDNGSHGQPPSSMTPSMRWESKDQKRVSLGSLEARAEFGKTPPSLQPRLSARTSTNPVGGASAFKWMSNGNTNGSKSNNSSEQGQ